MTIAHSSPTLTNDDVSRFIAPFKSGMIAKGPLTTDFETAFLESQGGVSIQLTNRGRTAFLLCLMTLSLSPDDEVIIPTYVCASVKEAVKAAGGKPVIADVHTDYCVSPDTIRPLLSPRTKAVLVVHTFGNKAPLDAISELIRPKGIALIEDCAHRIGDKNDVKDCVDFSFYSFQATKMMTTGEGGAAILRNTAFLNAFQTVKKEKSWFFSISDLNAALGLSQLRQLPTFLKRRREIAALYTDAFKNSPSVTLGTPLHPNHHYFRFILQLPFHSEDDFLNLRHRCDQNGIQIRKGVDTLLHPMSDFKCPIADALFLQTVSLPIYPTLTNNSVSTIITTLKKALHL